MLIPRRATRPPHDRLAVQDKLMMISAPMKEVIKQGRQSLNRHRWPRLRDAKRRDYENVQVGHNHFLKEAFGLNSLGSVE